MYYKKFEDLTFSDHFIFEKVLQNEEICTELLERLLHIKIDHIEYPEIEKTIKTMPNYFADYDTTVEFISQAQLDADHSGLPHGGCVIRSGSTVYPVPRLTTISVPFL